MKRSTLSRHVVPLTLIVILVMLTGGIMLRSPRTFTEADNGAAITLAKGDAIRIKLAENPTTGYSWNITMTDGLRKLGDQYSPYDKSGKRLGAGGVHGWDVRAIGTGDQKITGVYKRPWENATGNEQMYTLNVKVVEGGPLSRLVNRPVMDGRQRIIPSFIKTSLGQGAF